MADKDEIEEPEEELSKPEDEPKPEKATEEELAEEMGQRQKRTIKKHSSVAKSESQPDIKIIALISAVVCIVVVFAMGALGLSSWVTKSDFETNLTNVNTTLAETVAGINETKAQIDDLVQTIPGTVNNNISASVNNFNTQLSNVANQLNSLQGKVDNIQVKDYQQDIADISTDLANLKTELVGITDDIEELSLAIDQLEEETAWANTGDIEDVISLSIEDDDWEFDYYVTTDNTVIADTRLYVEATNKTTRDIVLDEIIADIDLNFSMTPTPIDRPLFYSVALKYDNYTKVSYNYINSNYNDYKMTDLDEDISGEDTERIRLQVIVTFHNAGGFTSSEIAYYVESLYIDPDIELIDGQFDWD